jgi:hypothetical protein
MLIKEFLNYFNFKIIISIYEICRICINFKPNINFSTIKHDKIIEFKLYFFPREINMLDIDRLLINIE